VGFTCFIRTKGLLQAYKTFMDGSANERKCCAGIDAAGKN
jgi:hypothetical protein